MRHGTSNRRSRNRPHSGGGGGGHRPQGGGGPNRAQVFDSNGPEVRIRGTAYQIQEKYMALAKDAASSGDSVLAESYLQHAEHYQRVINEWGVQTPRVEANQPSDSYDRASEPQPRMHEPRPQEQQRPAKAQKQDGEDLGLPDSILGAKREPANPELADA